MERPFQVYEGDGPYVFVCYSHQNREAVYAEIIRLCDEGTNVWYDEGISPATEWTADIARAIKNCEHFIFFVTPASVASEHCLDHPIGAGSEPRSATKRSAVPVWR